MKMFWPSIHPRSRNELEKAAPSAVKAGVAGLVAGLRYPIVRLFPACCALAASGHAAAPPSATSKSRRPMVTVMRPSSARVRKCNDTTSRARCPNSAAPGAGGARRALAWRRAASRADPRNPRRLPRFLDQRQRSRSFANDEDPGFLILSAVPMHLLAEMGDETAAGHGNHIVFVDFVAGCDPPRAFDHGDEAIVGMEMRLAEVARFESIEDDVGSALGRIALQDDLIGAGGAGRIAPLVLIGQSVHDGSGI